MTTTFRRSASAFRSIAKTKGGGRKRRRTRRRIVAATPRVKVYFNHFLPFAQRQFNAAKRIFPDAGSRRKNFTRPNRDGRSTGFGETGEHCVLRRCFSRREDGAETTGKNASSQNKKTSSGRSPPLKKRRSTRRAGKFAEAFGRNVGPDKSRPASRNRLIFRNRKL